MLVQLATRIGCMLVRDTLVPGDTEPLETPPLPPSVPISPAAPGPVAYTLQTTFHALPDYDGEHTLWANK